MNRFVRELPNELVIGTSTKITMCYIEDVEEECKGVFALEKVKLCMFDSFLINFICDSLIYGFYICKAFSRSMLVFFLCISYVTHYGLIYLIFLIILDLINWILN